MLELKEKYLPIYIAPTQVDFIRTHSSHLQSTLTLQNRSNDHDLQTDKSALGAVRRRLSQTNNCENHLEKKFKNNFSSFLFFSPLLASQLNVKEEKPASEKSLCILAL